MKNENSRSRRRTGVSLTLKSLTRLAGIPLILLLLALAVPREAVADGESYPYSYSLSDGIHTYSMDSFIEISPRSSAQLDIITFENRPCMLWLKLFENGEGNKIAELANRVSAEGKKKEDLGGPDVLANPLERRDTATFPSGGWRHA